MKHPCEVDLVNLAEYSGYEVLAMAYDMAAILSKAPSGYKLALMAQRKRQLEAL